VDPGELVDLTADERLLSEDAASLPPSVGRPEALPPPSPARKRLVGLGATLTGVTLVGGAALLVAGVLTLIMNGADLLSIGALAVGGALLSTHWGWVHVAEATADSIDRRRGDQVAARRGRWLTQIKPYTRYEVTTSVDDDGSIRIVRTRHEPMPSGERRFTFAHAVEHEEVHSGEEPGAMVTERAELLRRQAASDTERERELFEIALDAYETALLNADDEQQRQAARRAASKALSEQINANLRDPPLVE
jgi:hypothetical protein